MHENVAQPPERTPSSAMEAKHLIVLVSGVFHSAYNELLPAFKRESGVTIDSYLSPSMGESPDSVFSRLERGEPADVLIMAEKGLDHVVSKGWANDETRVRLAVAPVGIAVKAGSTKPDISTAEKLTQVLLAAKSVAYSISASGQYVSGELFRKLGIEDQMRDKAHEVQGTTPVAQTVADGTYEIGFQSLSELAAVDGIEIVGALPDPVGISTAVAAAVASNSRSPHEAAALLRFLSRSEFMPLLKKHGLGPPHELFALGKSHAHCANRFSK